MRIHEIIFPNNEPADIKWGAVVAWLAGQLRPDRSHHALDNYAGRLATHSERHEGLFRRGYVVGHHAIARVVTE